jgi:hypothetical protein
MDTRDIELMRDWHFAMYEANRALWSAIYDFDRDISDAHVWDDLFHWAMFRAEAAELLEELK